MQITARKIVAKTAVMAFVNALKTNITAPKTAGNRPANVGMVIVITLVAKMIKEISARKIVGEVPQEDHRIIDYLSTQKRAHPGALLY